MQMEKALNTLKVWLPILLLIVSFSYAGDSLAEEDYVGDEVIVKLKDHVNPESAGYSFNNQGKPVLESYEDLNVVVLQLTSGESVEEAREELESNPDVEYTEKNYVVRASLTPNDTYYRLQDYYGVIDAPEAWSKETGDSDVVIAVLDTGVTSTHPDISGKVLSGCNVLGSFSENNCSSNTNDDYNHGTAVAGTAAMRTNNSTGAAGTCWNCMILPVKVLSASGSGTLSDMIDGIMFVRNYALSNPAKKVIINLSLGRICSTGVTQAEQDAIDMAWASGILIVAAAGNDGDSQLQCPAMADHVIAVSATTADDQRAGFSSYGSFVDLAAPGVRIVSTRDNSSYAYWSGTSFSSPIVSGVAGLVWSIDPGLTNGEVDEILRDTAENIGSSLYFGDGRVNANFAVILAGGSSPTPTPAPTPTPTSPPSAPSGDLNFSGFDPGTRGTTNTLTVTGAASGSRVNFYYSRRYGTSTIISGNCRGNTLQMSSASQIGSATADSSGNASIRVRLSRRLRGTVYTQATVENGSSCELTNSVSQRIGSSRGGSGGGSDPPSRRRPSRGPRWRR
jgi:thermitase